VDCGGLQCSTCAIGLACKTNSDCDSGHCGGTVCAAKPSSTWKAALGAFVACLSVLMLLVGALLYMWWWKDAIAAEGGGSISKRPLEMAVLRSGETSGPIVAEEKVEEQKKDEHEPLADADPEHDHHAAASPEPAGEELAVVRTETAHEDDVYVS